jgi:hypothetical protein
VHDVLLRLLLRPVQLLQLLQAAQGHLLVRRPAAGLLP